MKKSINIGVVWLGYVWLPLAYNFAKVWHNVVWFDKSINRLNELRNWIDATREITREKLLSVLINYTDNPQDLKQSNVNIVAVPTPINKNKDPDYTPLINASKTIGEILQKWQIVVYESTVDPWATEEICLPVLEKYSNLKCPKDFKIWYSPERINPGDKEHTVDKIVKVVSWIDEETLETLAKMYESIISAWVHRASSIKVAEASKIIENTQRDINIAFMNELSKICEELWINTFEVLKAASTKWNFLNFYPGLVWWHCIWVDPYYLANRAKELWLLPEMTLAWRRINDNMPGYIANLFLKMLVKAWISNLWANVLVMWLTFKENVPDFRNSKISDTIKALKEFGVNIIWVDPNKSFMSDYDYHELNLEKNEVIDEIGTKKFDWIIFAQNHTEFEKIDIKNIVWEDWVVFDIKWTLNKKDFKNYKSL